MNVVALDVARQYVGIHELPGPRHSAIVLAMLQLDAPWVQDDETAWCSAFANWVCHQLPDVARSRSLAARSWLKVGRRVPLEEARPGWDLAVFKRGKGVQPGPDVIKAAGHVAFFVERIPSGILVLGGNQGNEVSIARYRESDLLAIQRIHEEAA